MSKLCKRNHLYEGEAVALDEIMIPDRTIERIMRKDFAQIEKMREDFENDRPYVRVVLRRVCGGYVISDGRHRVIAAKLAGLAWIEAKVIGDE